jgi:hypothetical protein
MNDGLNEDNLDDSINPSQNSSSEIGSNSEIIPINQKQETENMEVHHHSHAEHGKRNWKSYIWEFIMLFLAVFCGFLAEYQLEHVIENQREKGYVFSMIDDLEQDVEKSNAILISHDLTSKRIDSLLIELSSNDIPSDGNKAYQLWKNSNGFPDFFQNDRTIQQLKNSGFLRLIRIKSVSDKIMEYDQIVRKLYISQNNFNAFLLDNNIYNQLFDFIKIDQNKGLVTPIPLTPKGKTLLNEAYANRVFWRQGISVLLKRTKLVNEEGKKTIEFIKKEYKIED